MATLFDVGAEPSSRQPTSDETRRLRADVRTFLDGARLAALYEPRCDAWHGGYSPEFSRLLGSRGWIGMTWPKRYGGHERSALERLVVLEELLAAGAPVAAHWIADRQSGAQILRHGTEEARQRVLPAIAQGRCFVSLGMSEPDSGSDLASVRTRARRVDDGWLVNGRKIWTSHGHRNHFITVLCRTSESSTRHGGLSMLLVELQADGVSARPIEGLGGGADLAEVTFEDVHVPASMALGSEGDGWQIVTSELSLERSGPERYLSTFPLLAEVVRRLGRPTDDQAAELGALVSELWTLRQMSIAVAAEIDEGRDPVVQAALVKELGTRFEGRVIDVARRLTDAVPVPDAEDRCSSLLAQALMSAPGFTLRGGTSEILRGIVARALGGAR